MVKLEKIDGNKVVLEIEVDEEAVAGALDQAYRRVVKKVSVPGFRKGKVPRFVLEQRFGPEILYEDALDILIPKAYEDAVKETGISPIDNPEIDLVQMEKGMPLIFTAKVEVKPELKLGKYKGLSATKKIREITDDEVERNLLQLQLQHARLNVVDDDDLKLGDIAVIDFTGYRDGKPFAGGSAEGFSLEIGSNTFIPGFEVQLVGMKPGEEKEIEVTFPENYHQKDLAGEKATFKVKLNEIKRKEYPEINDDFAREISEFDTLAELKEDILNKLKEQEESRADAELRNKLIEMAAADSEVDLPEVLVERELDAMIQEMEQFLRIQGMTVEKFLEYSKKSMEDLRQDRKEEAQSRVKAGLVLDAIIEKEGISATDEELDEHLKTIADRYKQDVQKVKDLLAARGELDAFSQEIKYRKAIDFLVEQSDIVTEIIEKEKEPEADNAKNKEEIIAEQANNGKEPEVDSEEEVITDNGKEPEEKK